MGCETAYFSEILRSLTRLPLNSSEPSLSVYVSYQKPTHHWYPITNASLVSSLMITLFVLTLSKPYLSMSPIKNQRITGIQSNALYDHFIRFNPSQSCQTSKPENLSTKAEEDRRSQQRDSRDDSLESGDVHFRTQM